MFQFTHPGKGATVAYRPCLQPSRSFNSRTLGRVQLRQQRHQPKDPSFNSRTLGRVQQCLSSGFWQMIGFQFTHPGKGATVLACCCGRGDLGFNSRTLGRVQRGSGSSTARAMLRFNSRTLGRVQRNLEKGYLAYLGFQFTHPGKGATGSDIDALAVTRVSIHAPWEGCNCYLKVIGSLV